MIIDFLIERFEANKDKEAFILNDESSSYNDLLNNYYFAEKYITKHNISKGDVIAIDGDFSPLSTALMLALANRSCIIVPLTKSVATKRQEFIDVAKVQKVIKVDDDNNLDIEQYHVRTDNEIYTKIRMLDHPGLILFSSGSTGASKAAVHDFKFILEKYKVGRPTKRMITFLLFDHIGGVNTLLHNLSNGGTVITIRDRKPEGVLRIVEKYKVEVLPTSPTFINLLLLSESYKNYDLSSLETVSYGTEVMPESTLLRFHSLFPNIKLLQTYGLSEIGIMRSKSKSSDSLWVKIGGEGFETRVVDNMLEIKARSAMLGYLNAPSPFTEDGYFKTMDMVEVDGDYYKILGRKSEIINVGGEKVYPAEVESFFMQMDGVQDVAVKGESNAIMGNIVTAKFKLTTNESEDEFKKRMRQFAKGKLPNYKMPQKVTFIEEGELHTDRFKKIRK